MMFPKVFILTLLIVGTFGKGSIEHITHMEGRIEELERKLAALTMKVEMEDIGANRVTTNFVSLTYFSPIKLTHRSLAVCSLCSKVNRKQIRGFLKFFLIFLLLNKLTF